MVKMIRVNAAVDLLALIMLIPMAISGITLFKCWPTWPVHYAGYQGGANPGYVSECLGLTHTQWVMIHDISSAFFVLLVAVHLGLHWKFIRHIMKHTRGN